VFSQARFKELLQRYKRVQLYCDQIPLKFYAPTVQSKVADTDLPEKDGTVNSEFQNNGFGTAQLPLYVILEPLADGSIKIVGKYDEGKINKEEAFEKFLSDPLGPAAASSVEK
jgi:hypothetical protein